MNTLLWFVTAIKDRFLLVKIDANWRREGGWWKPTEDLVGVVHRAFEGFLSVKERRNQKPKIWEDGDGGRDYTYTEVEVEEIEDCSTSRMELVRSRRWRSSSHCPLRLIHLLSFSVTLFVCDLSLCLSNRGFGFLKVTPFCFSERETKRLFKHKQKTLKANSCLVVISKKN